MAAGQAVDRSPRPPENPRLLGAAATVPQTPQTAAPVAEGDVLARSLRPMRRPKALGERIAALKAASNAPGLDLSTDQGGGEDDLAATAPPTKKEKRRKKRTRWRGRSAAWPRSRAKRSLPSGQR
ncbi:MAG: hypothetical protein C0524_15890 [Rhodobacter sp.]|nr:hypothetical protein [Rhodobacter sp.]